MLSFSLGHSNLFLEIFVLLNLSLSLLLLKLQLTEKSLLLGILLSLELKKSLALEGFGTLGKSVFTVRGSGQGKSLFVSFLGGLLQSFFHGGKLLKLIRVLWLLDSLDLNDKTIASLNIHGRLNLNFLIRWWLFVLYLGSLNGINSCLILTRCNLLDLLPRFLSFGGGLHGFLLSFLGSLLISLIGLFLLLIMDITISLEETS